MYTSDMGYSAILMQRFLKERTPEEISIALARFEDLASRNVGNTSDVIRKICAEYRRELTKRWAA